MPAEEESHLIRERRAKVEQLRSEGREPYPWEYPGRVPTATVVDACRALPPGTGGPSTPFRVAGRIRSVRTHGKTAFLDLEDRSGPLQLFARVDELGATEFARILAQVDPGDLVGAEGSPMVTRRGEPSLLVRRIDPLAKALRPPPEKYHGLKDAEERIRRRYVDLLASPESRAMFAARSLLVRELRHFFDDHDFLEVETPVLGTTASGAAAQPFVTRSNYLDRDLQLRIALELPLKRLIVGGLERVYEISHVFRNEDMDSTHSPEFTMLEAYWAYADYRDMQRLTEELYERLARRVGELLPESPGARNAVDQFHPPLATIDWVDAVERESGIDRLLERTPEELEKLARAAGATVPARSPVGKYLDKLFEHYVEPKLERPTFVLDFPESTTPLAKRHRDKPGRVERFELFGRGFELANAYTELNDPAEQRRRFEAQLAPKGQDHYALDADFVEALEYGMPPATGIGIGVDRMIMALTGAASIKDVILFLPTRERDGAEPTERR